MLIKLLDFPDDLADSLKVCTGEATASKSVFRAASRYITLLDDAHQMASDLSTARLEIARLKLIIENARFAAHQMLDRTAQAELL
jgi:hypothetical protein